MADRKPSTTPKIRGRSAAPVAAAPGRRLKVANPVDDATLIEILTRFETANPSPRGELEHTDPYTLLVAVVLSAQATDKSVNLATAELFKVARTPAEMVALGEERLAEYIRKIGLYRTKAKNVIALSRILLEEHGSVVPPARAVLEALPGVGRKTASVVLNVAFGEPTIAVDTHVFRVSHRIPIVIGRTPDEVQARLEKRIPHRFLAHAHHWLILHGRYVCKARTPECPRCLINDLCRYPAKTLP
ncbi:endonuclease III [Enterovirga aerilata]|uniref:Endonuclease III n=1 Tax=Enterovirga aerilata TaxID=2730920 RepID=A0A849I4W7_9HYPH|nr:endonuclease III [Enterovirga sp. DB1703]NNM72371.1 endonuclease III [Enterovirga sp. DB1703]